MHWKYAIVLNVSVLTSCIFLCSTKAVNYFQFELQPYTQAQWSLIRSLERINVSYVFLDQLHADSSIRMLVSPEVVSNFIEKMNNVGMHYEALERNIQDQQNIYTGPKYNWSRYHTLEETYEWLRSLSMIYPKHASLFVAGKSYEGRQLLGIKISYGENDDKKAIFLEGGMHPREWISSSTSTFIANQLLTSSQSDVRTIAESFDWYILPHSNPDGYVYTHTTDRLWRKTRSPQANGCYGVDLNRNFDFHWNETGASSNPCDETYAGPKAFSEIEARTLAEYIMKLKSKLFMYVAYHSNRQKVLYPYAYTSKLPENIADLKRIYNAAVVGLSRLYGSKYSGGNIHDNMYPASGVGIDWIYAVAGVKYSFFYELCPLRTRVFGFKLPPEWIIPTGEETLVSLVDMVTEAAYLHLNVTKITSTSGQTPRVKGENFIFFILYILSVLLILSLSLFRI